MTGLVSIPPVLEWSAALAVAAAAVLAASGVTISFALDRGSRRRRIESLAALGRADLIVALGCPPRARNGRPSEYLVGRARATAAAYHTLGNVPILCSGRVAPAHAASSGPSDEAEALADLLVAARVPRESILFDRDAARTIDTIDHLARGYGGKRIVLVSQPFHLPRILFLAGARGLDAWGLAAPGPTPGWQGRFREGLGRLRAVWDVAVVRRRR
jgi:vancomycin permeability regulator SanA